MVPAKKKLVIQLIRWIGIREELVLIICGKLVGELVRWWGKTQTVHRFYNRPDYSGFSVAEAFGNWGASLTSNRLIVRVSVTGFGACGGRDWG